MDKFQIGNMMFDSLVGRVPQNPKFEPYRRREFSQIEMIVVHHTASDTFAQLADELAQYMANPNNEHGYPSIPYHAVIEKDGYIVVCQSLDTLTWQADGSQAILGVGTNNWRGIGMALMGDFTDHAPTEKQIISAKKLIAECQFAMGKWLRIVRHSDVQATQCPGLTSGVWFSRLY